jgi:hypothetical protein
MLHETHAVEAALRQKILDHYDPTWSFESSEGYLVNWLAISEKRFQEIKDKALRERRALRFCGAFHESGRASHKNVPGRRRTNREV